MGVVPCVSWLSFCSGFTTLDLTVWKCWFDIKKSGLIRNRNGYLCGCGTGFVDGVSQRLFDGKGEEICVQNKLYF